MRIRAFLQKLSQSSRGIYNDPAKSSFVMDPLVASPINPLTLGTCWAKFKDVQRVAQADVFACFTRPHCWDGGIRNFFPVWSHCVRWKFKELKVLSSPQIHSYRMWGFFDQPQFMNLMSYSHAAFLFSIRQQVRLLCLVGSHGRLLSVAASLTIPHCSCNDFWMLQADSLLYCFAYNKKFNKKTVDRPVPSVLHGSSYCPCVYRLSVCMTRLHRVIIYMQKPHACWATCTHTLACLWKQVFKHAHFLIWSLTVRPELRKIPTEQLWGQVWHWFERQIKLSSFLINTINTCTIVQDLLFLFHLFASCRPECSGLCQKKSKTW